jgi:hypothetical protein
MAWTGAPGILSNRKGAFGYEIQENVRGHQTIQAFHNMSSANAIPKGAAVVLSTNSTDGTGAIVTTVNASPLFVGVALTSASTGQSTDLASNASSGAWFLACVAGPVAGAFLTSGTVNGDVLGTTNSTVGSAGGGYLGPLASTQVAGSYFGVAGFAHTSGTTGTTGYLTTTIVRGAVQVKAQLITGSTL